MLVERIAMRGNRLSCPYGSAVGHPLVVIGGTPTVGRATAELKRSPGGPFTQTQQTLDPKQYLDFMLKTILFHSIEVHIF